MGLEIERKFLVHSEMLPELAQGVEICQGYFPRIDGVTVRIRVAGNKAFLSIKGPSEGIARSEFEYGIPLDDAVQMLADFCGGAQLRKTRYLFNYQDYTWEIDIFAGRHSGLILAEVELTRADERPPLPDWIAEEVSTDPQYRNSFLARQP